jgi:outer membrane protein TolC
MDLAESDRPLLLQDEARVRRARVLVDLAREELKPDFNLGFDYRIRAAAPGDMTRGDDQWSFSVGMSLPMLNRGPYEAEMREREAQLEQAQREYDSTRNRVREALENSLRALERARLQQELTQGALVPEAELSLTAARSAYVAGQVDLLTVLNALTTLHEAQLGYYRAVADHENAVADLEFVIGNRLF